MSDVTSRAANQDFVDADWEQAQTAADPPPVPSGSAKGQLSSPQTAAADHADKPWQPNLIDVEGEPAAPRSAIRDGEGSTIAIDASGRRSGWGFSTGSQSNVFGGVDLKKRAPVIDGGGNPYEIFVYRNEGLGDDPTNKLSEKLNLPTDVPGLDPQTYFRKGSESFKHQQFLHGGGFYPGDENPLGVALQRGQGPLENSPDLEERRWIGSASTNSGGYVQTYGSANPAKKTALQATRYIAARNDTVQYIYKSRTVEDGQEKVEQKGSAYAFTQAQVRIKAKINGDIGADIGSYSEAGAGYASTFYPGAPAASDWWLADGVLKDNLEDPQQASRGKEFADLSELGFQLKGESLLPTLGDRSAQVFLRVPDANVNFGNRTPGQGQDVIAIPPDALNDEYVVDEDGSTLQRPLEDSIEYRTQTDRKVDESALEWAKRKWPFSKSDQYISVDNLSAVMTQAASRAPRHMELAYVTPQALAEANKDKLHTIIDPTTGEQTQAFKVGEWVNTGLLQQEGQRGLFVDRDRLPDSLFNADGSIDGDAELPHWKDHLSPLGQESLNSPQRLQDNSELARDTDASLPPSLHNTQAGYLRDAQEVAERVNQDAGRTVVALARPEDAARNAGQPFTTVPRAEYYESARQYVEEMESYTTAIRDIYRAADNAGTEIPQHLPDSPIPASRHAEAAQERLDWIAAHRERVISQIDQASWLERETQDQEGVGPLAPRPAPSADPFPIK